MLSILYEDNHILVVEKAPNLPVQADSSGDMDLLSLLKDYIKEKYQKPGAVYLGLVHRLDRPVGGVMVFARTSKAAERLSNQFAGREAKKRYVAIVDGPAPQKAELKGRIDKHPDGTAKLFPYEGQQGKEAVLSFTRLAKDGKYSLLDVQLMTGRKHQIRLQLSGAGYPILHDQRYHPGAKPGNQICLWAYSLTFTHPTLKTPMTFTSLPKGGDWDRFSAPVLTLPIAKQCQGVYLDDGVAAVAKHAGIEVAAADAGEASLETLLSQQLGPVYPVHRLDANTEGMVVFARSKASLAALEESLKQGLWDKTYHAVAVGRPKKQEGNYTAHCKKDAKAGRLYVAADSFPGSKPMKTGVKVLRTKGALSLLEVQLFTGRTHQIRAHLRFLGCPVLGDDKYGDRDVNRQYKKRRQMLLCKTITLHMQQGSPLGYLEGKTFTCPWDIEL